MEGSGIHGIAWQRFGCCSRSCARRWVFDVERKRERAVMALLKIELVDDLNCDIDRLGCVCMWLVCSKHLRTSTPRPPSPGPGTNDPMIY